MNDVIVIKTRNVRKALEKISSRVEVESCLEIIFPNQEFKIAIVSYDKC